MEKRAGFNLSISVDIDLINSIWRFSSKEELDELKEDLENVILFLPKSGDFIVTNEDGLRVCRNCGLTFGQAYVESERRAYTNEEVQARRRTEPKWRSFGPRTVITGVNVDARGHQLEAKKQVLFSRLSKIQGSLVSSLERNFWEAKPKLTALANKMNIPAHIS